MSQTSYDSRVHVLLVDDDDQVLRSMRRNLEKRGTSVSTAAQAREALDRVVGGSFDAVVTDQYLPPGPTGIWLLENVLHQAPDVARILFSGQKVPHARELVRIGVVHAFLRKPLEPARLIEAVEERRGLSLSP